MGLKSIRDKLASLEKRVKKKEVCNFTGSSKPNISEERAIKICKILYELGPPGQQLYFLAKIVGEVNATEICDKYFSTDNTDITTRYN